MRSIKFAAGLFLASIFFLVQAAPLTTNAPSGYEGDTVTVILSEPTPNNLEGIEIVFTYTSSILTYISGVAGDIDPAPSLVLGLDILDVDPLLGGIGSISYGAPINTPTAGSLLGLVFRINAGVAPTTTTVNFSCFDNGGLGCVYDFSPVSATVTVLDSPTTPIPLPGTLPLLGLGAAALWWTRRRIA